MLDLWVAVVNTLLRSKEASRVWKSAAWGLSRWMLKSPSITKGVPSSGKVESNKSNSSTKLPSGPGVVIVVIWKNVVRIGYKKLKQKWN